jgi:hypothetical protein
MAAVTQRAQSRSIESVQSAQRSLHGDAPLRVSTREAAGVRDTTAADIPPAVTEVDRYVSALAW